MSPLWSRCKPLVREQRLLKLQSDLKIKCAQLDPPVRNVSVPRWGVDNHGYINDDAGICISIVIYNTHVPILSPNKAFSHAALLRPAPQMPTSPTVHQTLAHHVDDVLSTAWHQCAFYAAVFWRFRNPENSGFIALKIAGKTGVCGLSHSCLRLFQTLRAQPHLALAPAWQQ